MGLLIALLLSMQQKNKMAETVFYLIFSINTILVLKYFLYSPGSLIRPSVIFFISHFLQLQVGLVFSPAKLTSLEIKIETVTLVLLFGPLLIVTISNLIFDRSYYYHKKRILFVRHFRSTNLDRGKHLTLDQFWYFFLSIYMIFCVLYLITVGWQNTGLYGLISMSADAGFMREAGMKSMSNPIISYGFTISIKFLAPALVIILVLKSCYGALTTSKLVILMLAIALPASIFGSRGASAMIILTGVYLFIYFLGFKGRLRFMPVVLVLVLSLPLILMFLKMQATSGQAEALPIVFLNLFDRIVYRSLTAELWQLSYVGDFGFFGISGIPKIATIFGIAPIDIFNTVGVYFRPSSPEISATTSFLTANYALFGVIGILVSLFQLLFLDFLSALTFKLKPVYAILLSGMLILPSFSLAFSAFETLFISRGVLIVMLLYIIIILLQTGRYGFDEERK